MKLYSVDILYFTFTFDAVNKTVSGKTPDFKDDADTEYVTIFYLIIELNFHNNEQILLSFSGKLNNTLFPFHNIKDK